MVFSECFGGEVIEGGIQKPDFALIVLQGADGFGAGFIGIAGQHFNTEPFGFLKADGVAAFGLRDDAELRV